MALFCICVYSSCLALSMLIVKAKGIGEQEIGFFWVFLPGHSSVMH